MRLTELIEALPVSIARGDAGSVRITDLTEDSRTAMPGSLFIARAGLKSDGRAYIADACAGGAVAVLLDSRTPLEGITAGPVLLACDDVPAVTALLAERLHGNPSRRLLLAGVTGTNGKSTVAHLVHGLLNRSGLRCGLIGTVGIDDGNGLAPASMTTPPAIETSRTLGAMIEAGCDAAVMEVSSHALDQRRADGLAFDCGIFTNITGDHADYHPTFEHYLAAKRRLLEMLDGNAPGILNIDDPRVEASAAFVRSGRVVRCSSRPGADWTVERTGGSIEGESLVLRHGAHTIGATVPLIGAFNAMNICQAVVAAWALLERAGIDEPDRVRRLAQALSLATAPCGRLEPVHRESDDVRVFVDYAHTDDALDRALETVRSVTGEELTVVFGCGGDRDRAKRPRMGAAAARWADRIIVTSDNPRSEPPSAIVGEIIDGIPREHRARTVVHIERERAIEAAISGASPGGVVVIAGKGHETDQVSSDGRGNLVSRRFVDQEVARAALDRRLHDRRPADPASSVTSERVGIRLDGENER